MMNTDKVVTALVIVGLILGTISIVIHVTIAVIILTGNGGQ